MSSLERVCQILNVEMQLNAAVIKGKVIHPGHFGVLHFLPAQLLEERSRGCQAAKE
jgi:hypothetical protein